MGSCHRGGLGGQSRGPVALAATCTSGRSGAGLSQFYSANAAGPELAFKGCNITAQNTSDIVPSPVSTFLNVPMAPGAPVRSTGICNEF